MKGNVEYRVSAREIVDVVTSMRQGRLTKSPFFQRNLVWRETHKREFIETILAGLPFPQIFLARGRINVDTMEAYSCVVDGQQRLSAIDEYINGKFLVDGKLYSELHKDEKEAFLKYRIAVIDFDLDENDARLKDIFKRLNRTYYSLSTVEKVASEYSGSEFLVAARVLCGDFFRLSETVDDELGEDEDNPFLVDPSLPTGSLDWAKGSQPNDFSALIASDLIFSNYEAARQVPLMFVLTIMSTLVFGAYFNRTDRVREYLEVFNDGFPQRDVVVSRMNSVGVLINKAQFTKGAFWLRKTNFFTLAVEIASIELGDIDVDSIIARLNRFAQEPPARYLLAQREAVNSRRERILRSKYFRGFVINGDEGALTSDFEKS